MSRRAITRAVCEDVAPSALAKMKEVQAHAPAQAAALDRARQLTMEEVRSAIRRWTPDSSRVHIMRHPVGARQASSTAQGTRNLTMDEARHEFNRYPRFSF